MEKIFYIIIALFLFILVAFVCTMIYISSIFTRAKGSGNFAKNLVKRLRGQGKGDLADRFIRGREEMSSHTFEDLYIQSFDNLKLHAKYCKNPSCKKQVLLCVHGYQSVWDLDFSVVFESWFDRGYDICIIEQRTHGLSEGKFITFGNKERFDVKDWAKYLVKYNGEDVKILLCGMSMGCNTVVNAASLEDLPKNVCGVVADCGFCSPASEILHVVKDNYKLPKWPLFNLVNFYTKHIAGFDMSEVSTVESVKKIKLPILFSHGKEDTFVPMDCSLQNFENCASENKKIFLIDKTEHGQSFLYYSEQQLKEYYDFIENCFTK